jgi:thioredoxin reductase
VSSPAARAPDPVAYDCIIVGGGPAGLSAALMLGRCRRRVLLCDAGEPRNARARGIHGFLTRDGVPPADFHRAARTELERYPSIEFRRTAVTDASPGADGFRVLLEGGEAVTSRKLLLATGVVDELPPLEGLEALWGSSAHLCPYCDAWEWRDQPLAAYGKGDSGVGLALVLTCWSSDLVLCTDGPAALGTEDEERLASRKIVVREEPVLRLEGRNGSLERIVFASGPALERRALFLTCTQRQRSPIAERLGCRFTERGAVDTGSCEATNVPGLYVAGDASKEAQFVVVAAAEGAEAGMAIHKALAAEELKRGRAPIPAGVSDSA